jgi:hypothetical protein
MCCALSVRNPNDFTVTPSLRCTSNSNLSYIWSDMLCGINNEYMLHWKFLLVMVAQVALWEQCWSWKHLTFILNFFCNVDGFQSIPDVEAPNKKKKIPHLYYNLTVNLISIGSHILKLISGTFSNIISFQMDFFTDIFQLHTWNGPVFH